MEPKFSVVERMHCRSLGNEAAGISQVSLVVVNHTFYKNKNIPQRIIIFLIRIKN